jgi:hypothetical protein
MDQPEETPQENSDSPVTDDTAPVEQPTEHYGGWLGEPPEPFPPTSSGVPDSTPSGKVSSTADQTMPAGSARSNDEARRPDDMGDAAGFAGPVDLGATPDDVNWDRERSTQRKIAPTPTVGPPAPLPF